MTLSEKISSMPDSVVTLPAFPRTRYQGSKRKMLSDLERVFRGLKFSRALDLYAGSGTVSLLLRHLGKKVFANDYLGFAATTAEVFLSASRDKIAASNYEIRLHQLLNDSPGNDRKLVTNNFRSIYFLDEENAQIDNFCQNISSLNGFEKKLFIYAVGQALLMKRPFNLFHRANLQVRTKDVVRSFGNKATWDTPILTHALKTIKELEKFPFPEEQEHSVFQANTLSQMEKLPEAELVYLDPPYLNRNGVTVDYADFYHFLEGLLDYSLFENANLSLQHRPIIERPSAWETAQGGLEELGRICERWPNAVIVLSYRSDGTPTQEEIRCVLGIKGRQVTVDAEKNYKYVLSHSRETLEQVLISLPAQPFIQKIP